MTKFLNISTDNTLGGNSPSDSTVVSQKAIKEYVDGQVVSSGYHPDILTWEYDDHARNDQSWIDANTFSWLDGTVYTEAYQHLVDDIDGASQYSTSINGTTVIFYLADDKHRICLANQETAVDTIYNDTGSSWFFILDTTNQRFKLPRSKHNKYEATLGVVGDGNALGFTDGTDEVYAMSGLDWNGTQPDNNSVVKFSDTGGMLPTTGTEYPIGSSNISLIGINTDATKSGVIAKQQADGYQYRYLYFYVGQFSQSATEQTAGINSTLFNAKADTDLGNVSAGIDFVVASQYPTADNNYTWYRKYKSGWVEQGGIKSIMPQIAGTTITLPVEMSNTQYSVLATINTLAINWNAELDVHAERTSVSTITIQHGGQTNPSDVSWEVKGLAA